MKELIQQFYGCIRGERAVPIPYREILLTAQIMDDVFRRLGSECGPESSPSASAGSGA